MRYLLFLFNCQHTYVETASGLFSVVIVTIHGIMVLKIFFALVAVLNIYVMLVDCDTGYASRLIDTIHPHSILHVDIMTQLIQRDGTAGSGFGVLKLFCVTKTFLN